MGAVKIVSLILVFLIFTPSLVSSYNIIPLVSAVSAPPTMPSGYETKPYAFMYNCNFTSHAGPPSKNTTSIAFNQQEYKANRWNLKPLHSTLLGGYACIVGVIPSQIAARYGLH